MRYREYEQCRLCPRECGTDRYETAGYCGMKAGVTAAKAYLHQWEEPCISVKNGAGTIFFTGCSLHCCYCQNNAISRELFGAELSTAALSDIMLSLESDGADCIELITPTHFVPEIITALDSVKHRLSVPVVYNTGGYELVRTLRQLEGYIDVYLPDIKYLSPELSARYSAAPDYFEKAAEAVLEMIRQTGELRYDENGRLLHGTIIRHLVLPGGRHDSMAILDWIAENIPENKRLVSIMNQYTPFDFIPEDYPELHRRTSKLEYNSVVRHAQELGINGYIQQSGTSDSGYIPEFDLTGIAPENGIIR
ncbi:MAG: radical SAM protein [Ruminococcus sp.]|nr:radical SAM protein [Ruminococcus sp.]